MTECATYIPQPVTCNGHVRRCILTRLSPTQSDHRVMMCAVIDRIPAFLERLHSDSPASVIQTYVHVHWLSGSQAVAIWAAHTVTGQVIGHVIATMEVSWGVPYAMLIQTELDSPYLTTAAQRNALFHEMDVWAASQGAKTIKTLTPRNPKVYPRHNGFHMDKVQMVRHITLP